MLGIFTKKSEHRDFSKQACEFHFELPPYSQQENKLPDLSELWARLDAIATEPIPLLVELNLFLHELNRTYIGWTKRHSFTTRCLDYASPAVRHIFFEHQKGKALPEIPFKREALTAAITCVREISNSYKRIIKNECKISGKESKSSTRRLRQCMFMVLEMIHAEQRLKALRYQKLSARTWRNCNNVFSFLATTGETRKPFKPMGLNVSRSSAGESTTKSMKTSAEELFVLIQLLGLIDPNSLSLQQTVIVENYLKQFLPQLYFDPLNAERLPVNCVVTGYDHGGPPVLREDSQTSEYALVMDIRPLTNGLKLDYQRFLSQLIGATNDFSEVIVGEKPADMATISRQEDMERLLALKAMLKKLRETERADTRKYTDETQDAYVYNGFTAGFRMLSTNKARLNEPGSLQNQLHIDLAQRSASLADGAQEDKLTQWDIVNESVSGLLMRTKETQYIKNLFIGQLVIFAKTKAALAHPACGWIVRICRDADNTLEISLKILASQIESVVVQTEMLKKNAMGMPGIMIFDAGEDLQLLMHQSHRLLPGSNVTVQRGGNSYGYTIGGIGVFQREFVVYQLQ